MNQAQAKFRVVIVEDDASLRRLTKAVLERSGRFEVVGQAADGVGGISAAQSSQPELVLLDLAMPRMGGIEALPELRRVAPRAKVVALSMLRSEQYGPEVIKGGAAAFIDKSVPSHELIRRLLELLSPSHAGNGSDAKPPGAFSLAALKSSLGRWLYSARPRPAMTS